MSIESDVNLERARAHVRTQQRAVRHVPVFEGIIDAEILSDSPWPQHKKEAGWLFLQAFMELNRRRDLRRSDLAERARNIWSTLLERPGANPEEHLRAQLAVCYLPLWTHVKRGGGHLSTRKRERQVDQFRKMEQHSLEVLDNYGAAEMRSGITGIMSEINCADLLNRGDFQAGRNRVTIPVQTWFERNYALNPQSSFDLWQI